MFISNTHCGFSHFDPLFISNTIYQNDNFLVQLYGEQNHSLLSLAKEQGCTILMVTHDNRILDIADRIIEMEDGRLT